MVRIGDAAEVLCKPPAADPAALSAALVAASGCCLSDSGATIVRGRRNFGAAMQAIGEKTLSAIADLCIISIYWLFLYQ
jgi:hypothetical protein